MEPEMSFYEGISSTFDLVECYGFNFDAPMTRDCGFSPLFSISEDTSSCMFSNDHFQYPIHEDILHLPLSTEDLPVDLYTSDPTLSSKIMGIHGYPQESDGSFPSQYLSSEGEDAWSPTPSMKSDLSTVVQVQPSLNLPQEDMEMENQLSLPHLLEAAGEAIEQGQNILAQVILRCISHKVSPLGDPLERLAFNLSQNHNTTDEGNFIKQEACKNFKEIFRAFYQGLPHGKIAHFTANSAILESIPHDSEVIHIIDFDIGDGVQWPAVMEAVTHQHKAMKITSIKWEKEESPEPNCSIQWKFEETRRNLYEHARSCGLVLKVEEKSLEEMVKELKKLNKRGGNGNGKRNFLAFNCMVGLTHMGRVRSRRHVLEFLRIAKDFIRSSSSNRGIIAFGDGEASEKLRNSLNFRSFFNGHLVHYHALLESIESNFPSRFSEARAAMEYLFVAPYVSSMGWFRKWEEMREDWHLQSEIELEGPSLRKEIIMEVGELLRGSEGTYETRIEGKNGNQLALEWKGTQLLRISTWGN